MFYRFLSVPVQLFIIQFCYRVYTRKFAQSHTLVLENLSVIKSSFNSFVKLIALRRLCFLIMVIHARQCYITSLSAILLLAQSNDKDVSLFVYIGHMQIAIVYIKIKMLCYQIAINWDPI